MEIIIINFLYKGQNETIGCNKDEYMINIFKRYVKKIKVDLNNLYFLCNGSMINPELKLKNIL